MRFCTSKANNAFRDPGERPVNFLGCRETKEDSIRPRKGEFPRRSRAGDAAKPPKRFKKVFHEIGEFSQEMVRSSASHGVFRSGAAKIPRPLANSWIGGFRSHQQALELTRPRYS